MPDQEIDKNESDDEAVASSTREPENAAAENMIHGNIDRTLTSPEESHTAGAFTEDAPEELMPRDDRPSQEERYEDPSFAAMSNENATSPSDQGQTENPTNSARDEGAPSDKHGYHA